MNSTIRSSLKATGLDLQIGPFAVSLNSRIASVVNGVEILYSHYPRVTDNAFVDFYIEIKRPSNLRRWYRPQVLFSFDGLQPFKPLPLSQAFAFFEWGLNWCFAQHSHQYLIFHAAVVARGGNAVILPAPPGSGKSTLCAALMQRGWRLLSDELCMLDRTTGDIVPVPRPVSLKNESIGIIRQFDPEVVIGPVAHDTAKGSVAHLKVPNEMLAQQHQTARARWIVLPKYKPESAAVMQSMGRGDMFMEVAMNAFNYSVLGKEAYHMTADLVGACECLRFCYSRLDDAIDTFERLSEGYL